MSFNNFNFIVSAPTAPKESSLESHNEDSSYGTESYSKDKEGSENEGISLEVPPFRPPRGYKEVVSKSLYTSKESCLQINYLGGR
jgi:hypothetical protein